MTDRYTATDVLAKIDQERTEWETLLAEIGEERMETPGASGDWTVKDVIAHMSGWHTPSLTHLQGVIAGNPDAKYTWPVSYDESASEDEQVQVINAWLYEQNKDRPLQEVIAESRGQWDDLRMIVTSIPEDQLNDPNAFSRLQGTCLAEEIICGDWFSHYHDEHEQMLRDWLEEQRLR
jgi:hypothetical protein